MGREPTSPPRAVRAVRRGGVIEYGGSPPVLPGLSGTGGVIEWGGSPAAFPEQLVGGGAFGMGREPTSPPKAVRAVRDIFAWGGTPATPRAVSTVRGGGCY